MEISHCHGPVRDVEGEEVLGKDCLTNDIDNCHHIICKCIKLYAKFQQNILS